MIFTQKEGFLGGKPYIAGTRMSVHAVAVLYAYHDWSIGEIAEQHTLTPAQIHAALSYYYDNKDTIDTEIHADDEQTKQVGKSIRDITQR